MYQRNMSEQTTLLGTIGSWLGSIAAQVIGNIIAFIYTRVSSRFPNLSPPPHPLEAPIRDLSAAVEAHTAQQKTLRALLEDLLLAVAEPSQYEVTLREIPRPRRRARTADDST